MRFTAQQKNLSKELELLQSVAGRKTTVIPTLNGILVKAEADKLTLTAMDTEVSITTTCPINPLDTIPGEFILPAKRLNDVVKNFDNIPVAFELQENNRMQMICGKSKYNLAGEKAEKFPTVPNLEEYTASIPVRSLIGHIERTKFGIPKEEIRQSLKGLQLIVDNHQLTTLSVDGHKMPVAISNVTFPDKLDMVIPNGSLDELQKLLSDASESTNGNEESKPIIWLGKTENRLFFKLGDRIMSSRMLAGSLPDHRTLFPKSNDKIITVSVDALRRATKRAIAMADRKSPKLNLNIVNGEISINTESDAGSAGEKVSADSNGIDMNVAFSADNLIPCLDGIKTDKMTIELSTPEMPVLLKPVNDEGFQYVCLIVPLRLI